MMSLKKKLQSKCKQLRKNAVALGAVGVLLLSLTSTETISGQMTNATITGALSVTSNLLIVYLSGTNTGAPGCVTVTNAFAIRGTDKVMLAAVLSAQAQGKRVSFAGSGTCSVWGGVETADYFTIL